MINVSNDLLFVLSGAELDVKVREALKFASNSLVTAYEKEAIDLRTVTTKTHVELAFAKFAMLGALKAKVQFAQDFIVNAFRISQQGSCTRAEFEQFLVVLDDPELYYVKAYIEPFRRGVLLFMVSLHCLGAVVLPLNFKWTVSRNSKHTALASKLACAPSELISFMRSIQTTPGSPQEPAFKGLQKQKRIEWFNTYATRIVLACGWLTPEDVSFPDLLAVYGGQKYIGSGNLQGLGAFPTLIQVLATKFGSRLPTEFHDPLVWQRQVSVIRTEKKVRSQAAKSYNSRGNATIEGGAQQSGIPVIGLSIEEPDKKVDSHFFSLANCEPAIAHIERLQEAVDAATGDFEFRKNLNYWIEIQAAFLRQRSESVNNRRAALGYFSLYLFYYLPYWYLKNESTIPFPATPNTLLGSVFVSRLLEPGFPMPRTFVEFIKERAKNANWDDATHYAILKQAEKFFEFIRRNSKKLRDADDFLQPLSREDFPRSPKSLGTNKVPLPRRVLGAFIAYMEAYRSYVNFVVEQRISGHISDEQVKSHRKFAKHTDIKMQMESIGYVPIVFFHGRVIPLWWLPGFPKLAEVALVNGGAAVLPHPHALNQILVALYTGLRHNHIQWLDAEKFDSLVNSTSGEYAKLLVNTDKVKKKPWAPEVNIQVIDILRSQLRWRNAVDIYGFDVPKFYNNNPLTSYPKFLPLFSYNIGGGPHPDTLYATMWQDCLIGFQAFMQEHQSETGIVMPLIAKLAPPGVSFNDNVNKKRKRFMETRARRVRLRVATEITPHSARVGVVSELIRFMPASLIGSQITGQTEGTVYHYVVPDADEVKRDQAHQGLHLRELARKQQLGQVLGTAESEQGNPYVKADELNSRLARSMKVNMAEAFARYGCVTFTIGDMVSGLDVLEEIGLGQAAFNKTEVCPYGNQCPPDLIRELRGLRRCSICPYAVRSIDHLPAICARQKQDAEKIIRLDSRITQALSQKSMTAGEVDALEDERLRLGEDLAGWELCIEVLEHTRRLNATGESVRKWVVEQPEILEKRLERVKTSSRDGDYLLARLAECTSYPGFQSEDISKRFDMLRRRILVGAGASLDEVLSLDQPVDAAAECAGLLRSLVAAHQLSASDLLAVLTTDRHLAQIAGPTIPRIVNGQTS